MRLTVHVEPFAEAFTQAYCALRVEAFSEGLSRYWRAVVCWRTLHSQRFAVEIPPEFAMSMLLAEAIDSLSRAKSNRPRTSN